ncbi:DUF3618 domain-containing protein [Kutzneria sp. NPDC051319]|uniref:DUF3618 domain-containing protein n=1 Tax=Kutzneria sp. NPDC051319 TaxID=3155047 RepID=UPI0034366D30
MTTDDPLVLRQEIERTQRALSTHVDALSEKVTPSRIVERRVNRVRRGLTGMRDRVMGTASETASTVGSTVGQTSNQATSAVSDAVSEAPHALRRQTEGNPLAMGLIAFGVGWLTASLLPASRAEQQLAEQVKDFAGEHASKLGDVAQQVKDNLAEPAQEAARSVASTAQEAVAAVRTTPSRPPVTSPTTRSRPRARCASSRLNPGSRQTAQGLLFGCLLAVAETPEQSVSDCCRCSRCGAPVRPKAGRVPRTPHQRRDLVTKYY